MPTIEEFAEVLEKVIGHRLENLTLSSKPADIDGWDSLNHVLLIVELERRYAVKFKTSSIQKWCCVADILGDIRLLNSSK